MDLKQCPFCGGKAKISFKDYRFYGFNGIGDKKNKYRIQVICNHCKSRGAPVVTDWLINPEPYITVWGNVKRYVDNEKCHAETERFRPYVEKAIEAWNRRET